MSHRKVVAFGTAALVLIGLGCSIYRFAPDWFAPATSPHDLSDLPAISEGLGGKQAASSLTVSAAKAPSGSAIEKLPIQSLARNHQQMVRRALSGDLAAACEEARQLNQCAVRAQTLSAADQMQAAMAQGGTSTDDKAFSTVARLYDSAERFANQCSGVTDEMVGQAYDLQKLASGRGLKYARWLATNPALDRNNFVGDAERWADYNREAKAYFEKALSSKRLEDLSALLLVYYPKEILLPRPPYRSANPEKFLALYEVAVQNGISMPSEMRETADALRRNNISPDKRIGGGWTGDPPQNISRGISKVMFPDASQNFCN